MGSNHFRRLGYGAVVLLSGCFRVVSSSGGGEADPPKDGERRLNTEDIAVPPGYRIEFVATGLTNRRHLR